MVYLISYDLIGKPEPAYERLISILLASNAIRVLKSEWVLASTARAKEIFDSLAPYVDLTKDRLLVTEITSNTYGENVLGAGAALNALIASARG